MQDIRELTKSVQDMVLEHPSGAKSICLEAFGVDDEGEPNKSRWTLYKELNPDDKSAKLGYVDLIRLMLATNCIRPAEIMAAMLGKILMDPPLAGEVQIALSEVLSRIKAGLDDDGRFSKPELTEIFDALYVLLEKASKMQSGVISSMRAAQ